MLLEDDPAIRHVTAELLRGAGCAGVIGKPFDIDALTGYVRWYLGGEEERVSG